MRRRFDKLPFDRLRALSKRSAPKRKVLSSSKDSERAGQSVQ